jgi:hypothetical protein
MHDSPWPGDAEQWVIWNGASGILAMASVGRIEDTAGGRCAWMALPFDMLGPFSLDDLKAHGRITFAACVVMSRQRWQDDQIELRQEAFEKRRATQERLHAEQARFNQSRRRGGAHGHPFDERQHRETLSLPADGALEPRQIKKAYRRLAQKAHPDVGGSHEQFLRITEARNALLDRMS